MLISGTTRSGLPPDILCREVDTIMVVGQNSPVAIWQPCGEKTEIHFSYEKGLALYRAGAFSEAIEIFKTCSSDGPAAVMAERCSEFLQKGTPDGWNGVWILTSK